MEPTYFGQYKGYDLYCSPIRLRGGGFVPRLLVSADYGATEVDIPVPMQGPPFRNATEAAHRSFWQGRRWVDTGGQGGPISVITLPHADDPSRA